MPTLLRWLRLAALVSVAGACGGRAARSAEPAPAVARAECFGFQPYLDSVHAAGRFAGATLGVAFPDGSVCALATGWNDTTAKTRMRPADLPRLWGDR